MNMNGECAAVLLNSLWANMRQRALWHRGEGVGKGQTAHLWPAIEVYDDLERAIRSCGFDPMKTDIYEMLVRNPNTRTRVALLSKFARLLNDMNRALQFEYALLDRKGKQH